MLSGVAGMVRRAGRGGCAEQRVEPGRHRVAQQLDILVGVDEGGDKLDAVQSRVDNRARAADQPDKPRLADRVQWSFSGFDVDAAEASPAAP